MESCPVNPLWAESVVSQVCLTPSSPAEQGQPFPGSLLAVEGTPWKGPGRGLRATWLSSPHCSSCPHLDCPSILRASVPERRSSRSLLAGGFSSIFSHSFKPCANTGVLSAQVTGDTDTAIVCLSACLPRVQSHVNHYGLMDPARGGSLREEWHSC